MKKKILALIMLVCAVLAQADDTVVDKNAEGVQLWEGGPYWATCNVGATKPEECGYYFWWGGTIGYKRNATGDGWVSSKDGTPFSFDALKCPTHGKDTAPLQAAGYIGPARTLVAAYDAATAHLGAPWRMPTEAEFSLLLKNCTMVWTTRNGVKGRLFTGKEAYAAKSIFLPAAGQGSLAKLIRSGSCGDYWSSTSDSEDAYYAWYLFFDAENVQAHFCSRYRGQPVRPVRGVAK